MGFPPLLRCVLVFALLHWAVPGTARELTRFLVVGDVPYSASAHDSLDRLLGKEIPRGASFLVHVGDIKSGESPCTEGAFVRIAELFRSQPVPLVYTPGDNEWTDCSRDAAGSYSPRERLGVLRRVFYGDSGVLRLHELGAKVTDPRYPENYRLLHGDTMLATVHLVGSRDNRVEGDPAALAEHQARSLANRRHLAKVAEEAVRRAAGALVLVFHANAGLEQGTPSAAYADFRDALLGLLRGYSGPVLAVHGDTHQYRFDHPLRNPEDEKIIDRLFRLEVPGSPVVGGVWVSVDPDAVSAPFRVEPVYADAYRDLVDESQ